MSSLLDSDNDNCDLYSPVIRFKDGLPVRDLLENRHTEFEVRPEDDEDLVQETSAESCFNFDDLAKVTNLDLIDVDMQDGEDGTPFDRYRRKMTNLTEDGKLMKYVVKQGCGGLVPVNSIVYIRYQGYLEYAEVPFDCTFLQSGTKGDFPVSLNLAKGELLAGLYQAILSMRKGEKAEFLVHSDLAYGPMGCPPRVPPDATVLFVVEVDRFVDCGEALARNDDLSMEERSKFCNVIKIAKAHYNLAKDYFSKDNYSLAVNRFRQVINMMHNARLADEEEEKERNNFLLKNYVNATLSYHKLKMYKRVCIMAADAMQANREEASTNGKLMYFWGYAKMMLGDFEAAKRHLLSAKRLMPNERSIAEALRDLEKRKNNALQQEKIMMKRAFGFETNKVEIREIDETEVEFMNKISEILKDFKEDLTQDELIMRDNFTSNEERICLSLAKEIGLYARVIDGLRRMLEIKKPVDM